MIFGVQLFIEGLEMTGSKNRPLNKLHSPSDCEQTLFEAEPPGGLLKQKKIPSK